jgi:hypothetical protein
MLPRALRIAWHGLGEGPAWPCWVRPCHARARMNGGSCIRSLAPGESPRAKWIRRVDRVHPPAGAASLTGAGELSH